MCSGRVNYIFQKENDFTQEVTDSVHVAQLFRSVQHSFEQVDKVAPKKLTHPAIKDDEVLIPMESQFDANLRAGAKKPAKKIKKAK
jgi:hypothetical protein